MPVNPHKGERQEDFISRCIGEEISAGKEQSVAAAICYSYWEKDKMSKLRTSEERVAAKLKYNSNFRGINLLADGLEDACWDGYIAVGLKPMGDKMVPNCVPESENMESVQPTIDSSYAGEPMSGSVQLQECPPATQNIEINLKNRQNAIDKAHYGPLNPNEPNEDYWKRKADMFGGDIESAKKSLCGNCSFFVQTKEILNCIAEGINDVNEWDTIEAGDLGYCEAFDFKCAAKRTCDAWVVGGPITD